MDKVV
jgi:hypothetical protein